MSGSPSNPSRSEESVGKSGVRLTTNQNLDRIEATLRTGAPYRGALESLTALREHCQQMERKLQDVGEREFAKQESCVDMSREITALKQQIAEMASQQSVVTATLNADVFVIVEQLRAQNSVLREQIAALRPRGGERADPS